jgi:bifunctional non-homologous end joining protein LigD
MSLVKYNKKRKFDETPEPSGKVKKSKGPLSFVIQKHQATSLHYDFRLQHGGVLVSWAIPKGPMLNTKERHLAMKVEDHPIDYMKFEGVIPEGNYGAGTVIVWDLGNYLFLGTKNVQESEKLMKKGLREGQVKVVLNGKKVRGGFALIKTKGFGGGKADSWLLIKERDEYVSKKDITKSDKSVISGKNLQQMSKSKKVWHSNPNSK